MLATKPGWIGRTEVVEVTYDPKRITFAKLVERGEEEKIVRKVFSRTDPNHARARKLVGKRAVQSTEKIRVQDDKYYLSRTALKYVPMTPTQAMRVNARVGKGQKVASLLSPRQKSLLRAATTKPDAGWVVVIGKDVAAAWKAQEAALRAAEESPEDPARSR